MFKTNWNCSGLSGGILSLRRRWAISYMRDKGNRVTSGTKYGSRRLKPGSSEKRLLTVCARSSFCPALARRNCRSIRNNDLALRVARVRVARCALRVARCALRVARCAINTRSIFLTFMIECKYDVMGRLAVHREAASRRIGETG